MTLAVEDAPRLYYKARGMDFSGDNPLRLDLHAAFGENHPIESPKHNNVIPFDTTFHARPLAQHKGLTGNNRALDLRIDPKSACKLERALQANRLVEEASPVARPGPVTRR